MKSTDAPVGQLTSRSAFPGYFKANLTYPMKNCGPKFSFSNFARADTKGTAKEVEDKLLGFKLWIHGRAELTLRQAATH
jgi:hypothetical protein